MRNEYLARILVVFFIIVAVAIPVVGRLITAKDRENIIDLRARVFENGSWSLQRIDATVGEPVRLRMTSEDVVHGFAVGNYPLTPIELIPGEYAEATLTFDKPGEYTFFCNRWCGSSHTRMRGIIVVTAANNPGGK